MSPKALRLAEVIERLGKEPPFGTAEAALAALTAILNEVEDRRTGTAFGPARWRRDSRLYPPQADAANPFPGRPELTRYRTRQHNVWIAEGGAIRIEEVSGRCLSEKAGMDGRTIGPITPHRPPSPNSDA